MGDDAATVERIPRTSAARSRRRFKSGRRAGLRTLALSSGQRSGRLPVLWRRVLRPVLLVVTVLAAALLLAILAWKTPAALARLLSFLGSETPEAQAAELGLLLLVLLGFAAVVFVLWKVPAVQAAKAQGLSRKERAQFENTARGTLAQIVGGTAVIVGILFTWGNLQVAQQNADLARRGQVTERFNRAIDQLGAELKDGQPNLQIRLGGIYSLERIARESESEAEHWTIMEVLTTYVRENAPRKKGQEEPPSGVDTSHRPPVDIQAILTVIGRRTRTYGRGERDELNLADTDLRGAYLVRANLQEANLTRADLQGAYLWEANLKGARLDGNDPRGPGANLKGARLDGNDPRGPGANLQGAHLHGANLQGAILLGANLQEAFLRDADLQGAILSGANLQGVYLDGANLQTAYGLTQDQIDSAFVLREEPLLPDGLRPPSPVLAPSSSPSPEPSPGT